MKWFKHDADASIDAKIERLIMRYGLAGYGLYFYCLELIVGSIEEHNLTFELEHDAEIIAHRTGTHPDEIGEMMRFMVKLGLFEDHDGRITCYKVAKRLDSSMTSNPQLRAMIKRLHEVGHDAVMTPSCLSHDPVMPEEKEEKRKIDKAKTHRFAPPTLSEITEYCQERGNDVNPQKFLDHYEANGWMRGKTKVKDWKACVRTWERHSHNGESLREVYLP